MDDLRRAIAGLQEEIESLDRAVRQGFLGLVILWAVIVGGVALLLATR